MQTSKFSLQNVHLLAAVPITLTHSPETGLQNISYTHKLRGLKLHEMNKENM